MTESTIKDLQPTSRNKIIEAKVYRAWIARDPPDVTEKGYRAILLDRQGDAIQANVELNDKKQFTTYLIPGKTYRISGFTCIPTINYQQTLENKTSLLITRFTKFEPIPPVGFPNHYFDFVSYNRLPYKVVDPDERPQKQYPVLTDYIGCYIKSGEKEKKGNPNKDQMVIRRIEIRNLNHNSIELTLWDDLAENFPKEQVDALEKPVLIAVSSCRVTRYKNTFQLASTVATHYYINPQIPELEEYREQYRAAFNQEPPLQIVRNPFPDKEHEKTRNRIPLATLLKQRPAAYAGVRFTCEATITSLNTSREWYYPSCTTCTTKADNNNGIFECRTHGPLTSPTYRYNFKAYISDTTDTAMLTFFSPKADDIVGTSCDVLVKSLENPNPQEFPKEILSIIGKKHIFQFQYNTSSKKGPVNFILNQILDNTETPKQIENIPSGSSMTQQQYQNFEMCIPQQQQTRLAIDSMPAAAERTITETTPISATHEENNPGSSMTQQQYQNLEISIPQQQQTRLAIDSTPAAVEKTITETTPVSATHEENNPDVTISPTQGKQPTTTSADTALPHTIAKRQLFPQQTSSSKKNKKD